MCFPLFSLDPHRLSFSRGLATAGLACWMVLLSGPILQCQSVTALEAVHVAEIFSIQTARRWTQAHLNGVPHWVVTTDHADASLALEIWVHGDSGRVARVFRRNPEKEQATLVYQWPGVKVVAHRGGALLGPPENSLAAIEKAIEIGADLIEIDIRETADGHLVLMHDRTVDRTTDGSGNVGAMTVEEVRRLTLSAGDWEGHRQHVPTLREALELMGDRIDPDLDFKEGDLAKLLSVVESAGIDAGRVTYCDKRERCRDMVSRNPRIRIRPTAEYPDEIPSVIRDLRPAIINLDWHCVTEKAVRLSHLGGCEAFVNCLGSADTEAYIRVAARLEPDYLQSDQPDLVIRVLDELGIRFDRSKELKTWGNRLRQPGLGYPLQ